MITFPPLTPSSSRSVSMTVPKWHLACPLARVDDVLPLPVDVRLHVSRHPAEPLLERPRTARIMRSSARLLRPPLPCHCPADSPSRSAGPLSSRRRGRARSSLGASGLRLTRRARGRYAIELRGAGGTCSRDTGSSPASKRSSHPGSGRALINEVVPFPAATKQIVITHGASSRLRSRVSARARPCASCRPTAARRAEKSHTALEGTAMPTATGFGTRFSTAPTARSSSRRDRAQADVASG